MKTAKLWARSEFAKSLMGASVKYSPFRGILGHCLDDGGWDNAVTAADSNHARDAAHDGPWFG